MSIDHINLAQAPRMIRESTGEVISYRKLYRAVLDGAVPAEYQDGRWFLNVADLPTIAAALNGRARTRQ